MKPLYYFGFGLDSFVEVMSGLGIAHMIHRMRSKEINERDKFEITALKLPALPFISLSPDSWQEQGLLYLIRLNFELL